jgi:hypothetical protein
MPTRSQRHKRAIQGEASDGSKTAVTVANALVDQTSSSGVADSYQFASNSFAVADDGLPLRYEARSVVASVEGPLVDGLTFTESTRTFNWTLTGAGVRTVRVYATNSYGQKISDDFTITVS